MIKELFLQALAIAAVVSAVLVILLFPARRWLEHRYAPQVRWSLWRGIAFILILGIVGCSVFHMIPEVLVFRLPDRMLNAPVSQEEVRRSEDVERPESAGLLEEIKSPEHTGLPEGVKYQATSDTAILSAEDPTVKPRGISVSLLELLGWLWMAVALIIALRQMLVCLLTQRRMFRVSVPAECADRWSVWNERVCFRILPELDTPMTLGWIRPTVFLPQEDTAAMAVSHEVTHVHRRDILYKNVLFAACALFWFDPLVWLMAKAADRDMEAACDADVVKSCTYEEKRSYGELLIAAAAGGRAMPFSTRFGDSSKEMKFRLTQLMRPGKRSCAIVCVLIAAVLAVMPLVTCVGSVAEAEAKPALESRADSGAQMAEAGLEPVTGTVTEIETEKGSESGGGQLTVPETPAFVDGVQKDGPDAALDRGNAGTDSVEKEALAVEPERLTAEEFIIKDGILERYTGAGGDIVIPEGVIGIGPLAFYGCTSLTGIVLPAGVESIGAGAFKDCTGLIRADIAGGFQHKYDGEAAFEGCTGLKSVTIRAGWYLPAYVFDGCGSLANVVLPSGLEKIYEGAFRSCQTLKSVELPSGLELIDEEAFAGSGMTSVTIPSNVTEIRYRAFADCKELESAAIGEGVDSVGSAVFKNCSSLTKVTLPSGVRSIGQEAFRGCRSLNTIVLPEGLDEIGYYAFANCVSLAELTIPTSVTGFAYLGNREEGGPFPGCVNLTVRVPNIWEEREKQYQTEGRSLFVSCKEVIYY